MATAMNAGAEPFVPKEGPSADEAVAGKPGQGFADTSGAEVDSGGLSGVSVWRPQYKGRIRSFSDQKGFGFIDCAETLRQFGRDVFIHRFQMAEANLKVGQEVVFEVELNKMGHPQGRRIRHNEESMTWDAMGGMGEQYDSYGGMGQYGGEAGMYGGGGMGGGMYGGGMGGGYNQGDSNNHGNMMSSLGGDQRPPEAIEEMLRGCSGSADMWEIIEQYGHSFGKKHVITALYQLGLCRQYEKRSAEVNLTSALVDRLVLFQPAELTADEASRVLWALSVLDEVSNHSSAHRFAIKIGEQAVKRVAEFTPAQMTGFVSSLSRLVRDPSEDELVGKITTQFSDYALGGTGALPRFAPHELLTWTNFLKEAAGQNSQQPGKGSAPGFPSFMSMPGKGGGSYGQPGSYAGPGGPGMMPPWGAGKGMPGMPGMPPMGGKGGPMGPGPGYGGPSGYSPGKGGGKEPGLPFPAGPMEMNKGGGFDMGKGSFDMGKGGKPGFGGPLMGPGGMGGPFPGGGPSPGGRGKGADMGHLGGPSGSSPTGPGERGGMKGGAHMGAFGMPGSRGPGVSADGQGGGGMTNSGNGMPPPGQNANSMGPGPMSRGPMNPQGFGGGPMGGPGQGQQPHQRGQPGGQRGEQNGAGGPGPRPGGIPRGGNVGQARPE